MIHCVGLSHRSSSAEVRESLALTPEEAEAALERLDRRREVFILSTCNRTEFYSRGEESENPLPALAEILHHLKGVNLDSHSDHTYVWRTEDAVPHLFRVTSGLDSMVIGETEIVGQVRQAADVSARRGRSGPVLRRLVDSAVRCARRVRSETSLTEGSISMASVSVDLAAKVLGQLADRRILIVGAGETSRLAARHLYDAGVRQFQVVNRTLAKAQDLAQGLRGTAHELSELPNLLSGADLVFCATASPAPLVGVEMMRRALKERRGRSMVVVDLALPRDVDPGVNRLQNVFLYSTESVRGIVDENLERRRREAPRAENIVSEESAKFLAWYRSLSITPTLATMRARLEELRRQRLDSVAGRFRPEDREKLDQLTQSLVNDILREPTLRLLRAQEDPQRGPELADAVRHLFDLEETAAEPREDDADRDKG